MNTICRIRCRIFDISHDMAAITGHEQAAGTGPSS
jgi:hypothetical protein